MEQTTATFFISGEWATNHVRTLVEEGVWQDARTFLMEGLEGMTEDAALAVLKGEKRLVGDSRIGVELADQDPNEIVAYLQQIRWLYAGTVRERAGRLYYWKPYARVTGWSVNDVSAGAIFKNRWHSRARMPVGLYSHEEGLDWSLSRSIRYMDDQILDKGVVLDYPKEGCRIVLWKEGLQPPPWWPCKSSFKEGLREYLEVHGSLEERGAHLIDPRPLKSEPGVQPRVTDPAVSEAINSGLNGTFDTESPPVVGDSRAAYGFIARDGKFYPCQYFEHSALATRIVKHLFNGKEGDPEVILDDAGWIRCSISAINGMPIIMMRALRQPTEAQRSTTIDWCLHHQKSLKEVDFLQE